MISFIILTSLTIIALKLCTNARGKSVDNYMFKHFFIVALIASFFGMATPLTYTAVVALATFIYCYRLA